MHAWSSRIRWGSVALMAVLVIGGVGQMLNLFLRAGVVGAYWLPRKEWRVGWETVEIGGCFGSPIVVLGEALYLGPLGVFVRSRELLALRQIMTDNQQQ